jgi:enoyl-CoA hydratase/carnithine racemase
LVLPCDFRLAATTARFGFVFSRRGISADGCSSWFLPRIVGLPRASDWLLTGRVFEADEALATGLVSQLLPPEDLLPAAQNIARDLAQNCSPLSLALIRQTVWQMAGAPHPELAHQMESRALVATLLGPDPAEGIEAFKNRRPPRFTAAAQGASILDQ